MKKDKLEYILNGRTLEDRTAMGIEAETTRTERQVGSGISARARRVMCDNEGKYRYDKVAGELSEETNVDDDGQKDMEDINGRLEITDENIDNIVGELLKDDTISGGYNRNDLKEMLSKMLQDKNFKTLEEIKDDIKKMAEQNNDEKTLWNNGRNRT